MSFFIHGNNEGELTQLSKAKEHAIIGNGLGSAREKLTFYRGKVTERVFMGLMKTLKKYFDRYNSVIYGTNTAYLGPLKPHHST
jgi:hypothetical protein